MVNETEGKAKKDSTSITLNGSYNMGSITPFFGYRTTSYSGTDAKGVDLKDSEKTAGTGISVGANLASLLGGSGFVGYDSWTNAGGTEGKDTQAIKAGVFYKFSTAEIGMRN